MGFMHYRIAKEWFHGDPWRSVHTLLHKTSSVSLSFFLLSCAFLFLVEAKASIRFTGAMDLLCMLKSQMIRQSSD